MNYFTHWRHINDYVCQCQQHQWRWSWIFINSRALPFVLVQRIQLLPEAAICIQKSLIYCATLVTLKHILATADRPGMCSLPIKLRLILFQLLPCLFFFFLSFSCLVDFLLDIFHPVTSLSDLIESHYSFVSGLSLLWKYLHSAPLIGFGCIQKTYNALSSRRHRIKSQMFIVKAWTIDLPFKSKSFNRNNKCNNMLQWN